MRSPFSALRRPSSSLLLLPFLALLLGGCESCSKPDATPPAADAATTLVMIPDAAPINATPLPTAMVAALLNPDHLPAYAGPTGSVEGTITVTGAEAPETPANFAKCPDAANTYARAFREGQPATAGGPRWLADAVIAITGYSGFYIREKAEAEELEIKGCAFSKRTVTMTFGQRLEVKNLSKEFWTPLLEPGPNPVMMMAAPNGADAVKIYPKKPGYFRLVDHDRRYAVVELYAFLHPLHTTSDLHGSYRIDDIPVGRVKVNTSHPSINGSEAALDVEIKAGVILKVDLTLENKRSAAADAGAPARDAGDVYPSLH